MLETSLIARDVKVYFLWAVRTKGRRNKVAVAWQRYQILSSLGDLRISGYRVDCTPPGGYFGDERELKSAKTGRGNFEYSLIEDLMQCVKLLNTFPS